MKNLLAKIPNEKAKNEFKQFLTLGYICTGISLVMFGFLPIIGLGAAARCLVLSNHKGNKDNPKLKQLRLASIMLLVLSVVSFIGYTAS